MGLYSKVFNNTAMPFHHYTADVMFQNVPVQFLVPLSRHAFPRLLFGYALYLLISLSKNQDNAPVLFFLLYIPGKIVALA